MRLKFISILASWLMFVLAGILPCSAVNVIPYPQSVEMTDVVFNKKKIDKVKYVTDKDMPSEAYERLLMTRAASMPSRRLNSLPKQR